MINKKINGKQCIVGFHVDDLKISHVNLELVTTIINELDKYYVETMPLSIRRGNIQAYIGMVFDYKTPKELKITMHQ